jgi:hypothetical protein
MLRHLTRFHSVVLTRKSIPKIIDMEHASQYSQHHLYSLARAKAFTTYQGKFILKAPYDGPNNWGTRV